MTDRRRFIQNAGIAAAASLASVESARGFAANDTINVACIGTGGRCRRLMTRMAEVPNVRMSAVCDIWDHHLSEGRKLADSRAVTATDYHKLLERKDIDAVLIGSPDHWHAQMTIDACQAGKDVYVEKPLTHAVDEGPKVVRAQNASKRIVQVGTQQRSMPHLQEAKRILASGELGPIYKVHMSWNRNVQRWSKNAPKIDANTVRWKQFLGSAREQPFDAYRFRNWRWFWDFGGGIFTDLMVHWMDTAYWMLNMQPNIEAVGVGDHFAARGIWETPDSVQTLIRFPKNHLQVFFEGTFVNHEHRARIEFMGANGNLYCDRGRFEVHPQRGSKVKATQRIDGKGVRGADFFNEVDGALFHLQNWSDCMRTRKTPACPAEDGARSAATAHFANQAMRERRLVSANQF